MLFQTPLFWLFCLAAFGLYWRFPRARLWVLAIANAIFYLAAGWQNLGLFIAASATTYAIGHRVTGPHGRLWLAVGILVNLLNLLGFKYAGFLYGNVAPWLPADWLAPWFRDLLLPIGISFYTFQHISYMVDRRLRDLPSATSYLHFWVYISFFGHSIAGPIMRGHEFFPQIDETHRLRLDGAAIRLGLGLFTLGLLKKLGIADQLAPQVGIYFDGATNLTMGEAWVAALLFSFQIYYDFSAYSDMAVGIGHLFGYTLRRNFLTPYIAVNAGEFWRRWHVTLSEWIRDYIYIPLGGNRQGVARSQLNLAIAMLVSGLWHGANWTFVIWGAWHALLLVGQRAWHGLLAQGNWRFNTTQTWRIIVTPVFFMLVTIGWVFFRASDLEDASLMLRAMSDPAGLASFLTVKRWLLISLALYGLHIAEWAARRDEAAAAHFWVWRTPVIVQGFAYAAIVTLLMLRHPGGQSFIYFRF